MPCFAANSHPSSLHLLVALLAGVSLSACSEPDSSGQTSDPDGGTLDADVSDTGADTDISEPDANDAETGEEPGPTHVTPDDFNFVGAFRVPAAQFGASDMNYSEGPIALHPERHSVFLVGHAHQQAIAEFEIPELVNSAVVAELNTAPDPLQVFSTVLNRVDNPQAIDRVGGLAFLEDGDGEGYDLLIHAYEYYDAPADNTHTTLMLRDPDDLEGSEVEGYYALQGRAHANGWVSPIPQDLREDFGATHLTGSSGGYPIHGRASIGPTFFTFDPADLQQPPSDPVPTQALLDFSLGNPLHDDMNNDDGTNDLWTHLSRATYGFLVPNTQSYLVIGYSGGHESGICYKCTPEGATADCGGYCARNVNDYTPYFWTFDINDLLEVQAGDKEPHQIQPLARGPFEIPFTSKKIGGGAFDPATNRLYLTAQAADREGTYSNPPVIMVYELTP